MGTVIFLHTSTSVRVRTSSPQSALQVRIQGPQGAHPDCAPRFAGAHFLGAQVRTLRFAGSHPATGAKSCCRPPRKAFAQIEGSRRYKPARPGGLARTRRDGRPPARRTEMWVRRPCEGDRVEPVRPRAGRQVRARARPQSPGSARQLRQLQPGPGLSAQAPSSWPAPIETPHRPAPPWDSQTASSTSRGTRRASCQTMSQDGA